MKTKIFLSAIMLFVLFCASKATAGDIRSAGIKGNWNITSTWEGGVVPSAADNVIITNGDTVYYNLASGVINNITVGESANVPTAFMIKNGANYNLTVNGNITVSGDSAKFIAQTDNSAARTDTLFLKGNLISNGTIDFKVGTSPNNSLLCLCLEGSGNSIINVKPFVITPATVNEFAGIVIRKTGTGKVILNSDIGMSNISAAALNLVSGIVETGQYTLGVFGTGSASVVGGSAACYINGKLGRGFPSSGSAGNKFFPIGDATGFRPAYFSNTNSAYHYLAVEVVTGNANTGSSALTGGIDKVSAVRYYKATVDQIPRSGNVPSPFYITKAGIGYNEDDGVAAGNTNLRIAVSYDNRGTWNSQGPSSHTTAISTPPTEILSDSTQKSLDLKSSFYVALARVTGTTENSLGSGNDVKFENALPGSFELMQNYPNPFNPSTSIRFRIEKAGLVMLKIYDMLGKEIKTLLNEYKQSGTYSAVFNAGEAGGGIASGIYLYKLTSGGLSVSKKMLLIK
jgi:hypothetical protein